MNNDLILLSKNDIPFLDAQVNIHQPTISEISLIGEENFWSGCRFLNFSKSLLAEKDKNDLANISDFEIFMSIMSSDEKSVYKNGVNLLLVLLFPDYQIRFTNTDIVLFNTSNQTRLNATNYDAFKDIINTMFRINEEGSQLGSEYNPTDNRANKIAEKLRRGKKKVAELKGETSSEKEQKVSILSRYVSILAVGLQKNMNELMNYTVSQLLDEFKRFQMKQAYDINISARMAGATNLDDVDNWMDEIHS